jgi:hypothetical protein
MTLGDILTVGDIYDAGQKMRIGVQWLAASSSANSVPPARPGLSFSSSYISIFFFNFFSSYISFFSYIGVQWLAASSSTNSVPPAGFRVQGSGFRVQGSGLKVQGSGFKLARSAAAFRKPEWKNGSTNSFCFVY